MKTYIRLIIVVSLLLIGNMVNLSAVRAQEGVSANVELLSHNVEPPARVTLDVRISVPGNMVTGLTPEHFSVIGDQASNMTVKQLNDAPMSLLFVIDASKGSEVDSMKTVLQSFFRDETHYHSSDHIKFIVMTGGTSYYSPSTTNQTEILNAISNLNLNTADYSSPADIMPYVLSEAQKLNGLVQVIYMGTLIYKPANLDFQLTQFRNSGIPVHLIQTHIDRPTNEFLKMRAVTNSIFVDNNRNDLVGSGSEGPVATGALNEMFVMLGLTRTYHRVTYDSTASGNQTRSVTLNVRAPSGTTGQTSFDYNPSYAPPQVEIVSPTNLNPARRFDPDGNLDTPSTPIHVTVTYPDNAPRAIRTLEVEILDDSGNPLQSSIRLESPNITPGQPITLDWSLDDYNQEGQQTPVTLKVTAHDEYGLSATTTRTGQVNVGMIPTKVPIIEEEEPNVTIIEPRPIAPERNFIDGSDTELDNAQVNVVLRVVLPKDDQGNPYPIQDIRFNIIDPETSLPKQEFTFDPSMFTMSAEGHVTIPWDISIYNTPDSTTNLLARAIVTTANGQTLDTGDQPASVAIGAIAAPLPTVCRVLSVGPANCGRAELVWQITLISIIVLLGAGVVFLAMTRRGREYVQQGASAITNMGTTAIETATSFFITGYNSDGSVGGGMEPMPSAPVRGYFDITAGRDLVNQTQIPVTKELFTIGRNLAEGADFELSLKGISRRHFTLRQEGDNFTIEDHESANGTYLNDERIMPHQRYPISLGDRVRISQITLAWRPVNEPGYGGIASPNATTYLDMPTAPQAPGMVPPVPVSKDGVTKVEPSVPPAPSASPDGVTELQPPGGVPSRPAGAGATELEPNPPHTSSRRLPAKGLRVGGNNTPPGYPNDPPGGGSGGSGTDDNPIEADL